MRFKLRPVDKSWKWKVYDYVNKVIESCETYEHLLTVEGWIYNISEFDDMELHTKLIQHIHYKEDELLDQALPRMEQ
jgi:hypothetical protein